MNERKQDGVRLYDRRQLATGILALLGMAVLLIVGLTPRRADAPDTAQTVLDATQLTGADCQLVQRMLYTPCGHEVIRRQPLPGELTGRTMAEVAAAYGQWQITAFSPAEVVMEQSLSMYCPEHMILMPDGAGLLCIWHNRYGDALALHTELNVPLAELPAAEHNAVRAGKPFSTLEELTRWLDEAAG